MPTDDVRNQFKDHLARETGLRDDSQTAMPQTPDLDSINIDVPAEISGITDNPVKTGEAVAQAGVESGIIQDKIKIAEQAMTITQAENEFPAGEGISQLPVGQILQMHATDMTIANIETAPQILTADNGSRSDVPRKVTTDAQAPLITETPDLPEAITPDLPEAATSEIVTPEAATSEIATPEAATSEIVTPEAATSEIVAPEAATSEIVTPEAVKDSYSVPNAVPGDDIPTEKKTTDQNTVTQSEGGKPDLPADPRETTLISATFNQQTVQSSVTPPQQLAATPLQPVNQNKPENSKTNKNFPENSKETPAGAKPASIAKGNAAASADAVKASQTSGNNRNFTEGLQDKPPVTDSQRPASSTAPLPPETGQILTSGEGKIIGSAPLQMQAGLLSLQEIGQGIGQVKTPMSPGHIPANSSTGNPALNPPSVNPQMVAKQISLAMVKQSNEGGNSFKISLKPAELGQVDIKMDIQADGRITATIAVDNKQTLNLLHRDQAALEKALANSGFDAGGNNLNFTLRHQQQNPAQSGHDGNSAGEEGDDFLTASLPHDIIDQQLMKITYSDNILDINI